MSDNQLIYYFASIMLVIDIIGQIIGGKGVYGDSLIVYLSWKKEGSSSVEITLCNYLLLLHKQAILAN